ncbi:Protoporphyrinogen oxidase [Hyphodiscus hymeniophilus]|uniref:protoporphyrinogen oxidase n=1 Tax=Hyphodiscus hymeniophilus TaxID=353542 RepID=A0A9P6VNB7_9HELO|nr:Protoporphyrinogen oxidase [Hyphodiscus hymeniophilus]
MSVEVVMESPLAHALNNAIQPKLVEVGWSTGGGDESALSEYIILMLVNGKTQDQIASELSGDLLNLGPDDPGARDFAKWLFGQVDSLNSQLSGHGAGAEVGVQGDSNGTQDADMGDASEVGSTNVYAISSVDLSPELPDLRLPQKPPRLTFNRPTGPKSMRTGGSNRSSNPRDKRMLKDLTKTMDRSNDAALHRRTQGGNDRINTHRAPPTGPRQQTQIRGAAARATNNRMGGGMPGMQFPQGPAAAAVQNMTPQQQVEMMALFEQQARFMAQLMSPQQQQAMVGGGHLNPAMLPQQPGKSLFDRVNLTSQRPQNNAHNRRAHAQQTDNPSSSMDVEMSQDASEKPELDPHTPCKWQLKCTREDCMYAHQSPAAKAGAPIDVDDVCSYGAACTNYKCTGRHPSPAKRLAHVKPNASEIPCIFDPNCTKRDCPYKHSKMPICRNGADCTVADCKFTHNQTVCKFNPCNNPNCIFKHPPGHQRGKFADKVWTADNQKEHVSQRKFIDENAPEELIIPGSEGMSQASASTATAELITGFQSHAGGLDARISRGAQFAAPTKQTSGSESHRKHIAILGGGITGISAAYYIAREIPTAKITIYEASKRLGGWLQSKSVDVGNGDIVFESGPRTLRPHTPAGMVTVEMIDNLNLRDELIITSRDSVAAQNRFVYYPDHLVKMPGPGQDIFAMMWTVFTEPVFKGWATALLEIRRPPRLTWAQYNNPDVDDESVGSFLERRTGGTDIGNNVISAVLHGIYAGDINQLSARSLMPGIWYDEAQSGSGTKAMYNRTVQQSITAPYNDVMLQQELQKKISQPMKTSMASASVYTFKTGIGALSNALEKSLRANPNVEFKMGHAVIKLENDTKANNIAVTTKQNMPQKYTNVISTLYGKTLSEIAEVPALSSMHAVTVMVVNLYYTDPDILPDRGFGYLLPRSIPFEQNPECALGVVFDSDATVGLDTAQGTKITVMFGGHWWDGMESYPDEEKGAAMAQSILLRHLNISQRPAQSGMNHG